MNIGLIGYGKMGKEIEKIAIERGHQILFKFDLDNQEEFTFENLKKLDVAIEFSQPDAAFDNYMKCFDAGIPVVSGTTGWTDKMPAIIAECEKNGKTFFYASNFSIGVNIFFKVNRQLAALMNSVQGYDVSIDEIHHTEKKDAPSGTAVTIAEDIIAGFAGKKIWVKEVASDNTQLAVRSFREGTVPGIHSVKYESEVDYIQIKHSAKSRKGFAEGAVLAAEFTKNNKGFLTMDDLLDAKK